MGYVLLRPLYSPTVFGLLLASVAGIMVFVSVDELLPAAHEYDTGHIAVYGFIVACSLWPSASSCFLDSAARAD